jgi:bifunctional enzyme CysN/CysC
MDVMRSRDQSGAYRLADEGKIAQMPGVTAAFEEPKSPDLLLRTDMVGVEESVDRIIELMKARGYLGERR